MLALGRILLAARIARGVRLRDVEDKIGVSNAYLSQLERGLISEPSPHKLYVLARFYELEYSMLMSAAGYPSSSEVERPADPRFMGEPLTAQEVVALAAFLRTYREVVSAQTQEE